MLIRLSGLNILFTHPDYRRQGIANLMMEWGKKKANETGVEMWLDATIYGIPLYKKHGFVVVNENNMDPKSKNTSPDWQKIESKLVPMVMWQMWRPVGHDYEGDKDELPGANTGKKEV